uniref:Uncharacterized protein n=1 Tax=Corethron hystrix TaxID=216773 RepID=A0A7S1BAT7_9STRA|mmetsp:Transcript_19840/g.45054  ORF Transcript_19840/g.45054 Transcript_19840/m.45054 type:complete len:181 (+) Transcript_19840:95-637(+)
MIVKKRAVIVMIASIYSGTLEKTFAFQACHRHSATHRKLHRHSVGPIFSHPPDEGSTGPKNFFNDGPFAWMAPFMEIGGITEGKRVVWGVLSADAAGDVSDDAAVRLRDEAAADMVNIDGEERARRATAAGYILGAAFLYAVISAIFWDDGGVAGHVSRFGVLPLYVLGQGYRASAQEGL